MDNLNEVKQRDLVAYAEQQGYKRIEAKCSPHSVCLALGDDKIIVKVDGDNHFVYCNVHDDRDQGSIVDFVMKRQGVNYVGAMKALLRLETASFPTGLKKPSNSGLSKATEEPDRKKCLKVWDAATWNPEPAYLLSRGLTAESLADERFRDTFRVNPKGAVMFLHRDRIGPTGYELRGVYAKTGEKLKAFMADGKRGLWYSNNLREAKSIIVCESAIDCLSHYELYGWDCAYVSIGGAISSKQKDLLAGLFAKVTARNGLIIIGTDNDAAGDDYFTTMQTLTQTKLKRHCPIGNDWNADLTYVRNEA